MTLKSAHVGRSLRNGRLIGSALLAVAVATAAATGASGAAAKAKTKAKASAPLRIMVSATLSGATGQDVAGAMEAGAAKAAVAQINGSGGIGGRKIALTVVDDTGDPTIAVSKLQAAISSKAAPDVYLPTSSAVEAATLPLVTRHKILSFGITQTSTSGNPSTNPYNFDVVAPSAAVAAKLCSTAASRGYSKVGLLYSNSAFGATIGPLIQSSCQGKHVSVSSEQFDTTSLDMTAQLEALKSDGVNALIVDSYGSPTTYILQDIQRIGWNVPVLGDTAVASSNATTLTSPSGLVGTSAVNDVQMVTISAADANTVAWAGLRKMKAALVKEFKGKVPASFILAQDYDAVELAAAASKAARSVSGPAMAKILVTKKYSTTSLGYFQYYNFTTKSHDATLPNSDLTLVPPSVVKNGQYQG
jgi:branched-chain amino acid transport system substrate-binding protein